MKRGAKQLRNNFFSSSPTIASVATVFINDISIFMQTQMATLLALLLALCFQLPLSAQPTEKTADMLYLNSGKPLVGKILRYEQGKAVTILLENGEQRVVDDWEVKKIVQGVSVEGGRQVRQKMVDPSADFGWYHQGHLRFAPGTNEFNEAILGIGFELGSGYRGKHLGFGLGIGADSYGRQGETVLPVSGELLGYLPTRKGNELYLSAAGGYGFAFKQESASITDAEGGPMWHPAIGIQRRTREDGLNVRLDLGVRFQRASFTQEWFNGDIETRDILYRRVVLRFGVVLR